jgi:hypothetical protein
MLPVSGYNPPNRWVIAGYREHQRVKDGGRRPRLGPTVAASVRFTSAEWAAFLDGARKGEFDHLAAHGEA